MNAGEVGRVKVGWECRGSDGREKRGQVFGSRTPSLGRYAPMGARMGLL